MRQRLALPLFLILLLLAGEMRAQSTGVSGVWLGRLKQEASGPFVDYRLRLELKQEGAKVTGISYIHVANDPDYFGKMKLEGRFDQGKLTFHEVELLNSVHADGWGWCLKRAELTLKQVGEYRRLDGPWQGYMDDVPCAPGTITVEQLNPQAKPPTPPTESKGEFGIVEGRKITHRKDIPVYADQLTLYIWDGDKVDGDIISLQYNGEWLLRKHAITKDKKALVVNVVPGAENQLILYAENQGQYPPNTAAVTFFDGKQERNLSLSSDGATCGALRFVVTK